MDAVSLTHPQRATYALERGWLSMSVSDRQVALYNLAWGYDDEKLTTDDLCGIVIGQFGNDVATRFVHTLRRGVTRGTASHQATLRSFANTCVNFGRYDILERMATLPAPVLVNCLPYGPAEWLDMLATRSAEAARPVLEFAFKHQPEHPHIQMLIERGGPVGAVMAELVMAKCMQAGRTRFVEEMAVTTSSTRRRAPAV
jgi:hypothetical protein